MAWPAQDKQDPELRNSQITQNSEVHADLGNRVERLRFADDPDENELQPGQNGLVWDISVAIGRPTLKHTVQERESNWSERRRYSGFRRAAKLS